VLIVAYSGPSSTDCICIGHYNKVKFNISARKYKKRLVTSTNIAQCNHLTFGGHVGTRLNGGTLPHPLKPPLCVVNNFSLGITLPRNSSGAAYCCNILRQFRKKTIPRCRNGWERKGSYIDLTNCPRSSRSRLSSKRSGSQIRGRREGRHHKIATDLRALPFHPTARKA